jgi:geranylgeranyl diphosphate synthase type I
MLPDQTVVLNELLPQVRRHIEATLPAAWPALGNLVREHLSGHPLPPPVILPLASCAAVGGQPEQAVPTAAAWALLLLSLRWFDDAQDQDRADGLWARVGVPRATNFAAAALTLSWKALTICHDDELPRPILDLFAEAALELADGQEQDLRDDQPTVDCYWELMRKKCGSYFRLAAQAGALHGTRDPDLVAACGRYGEHVGLAIQILDDLEGVFFPRGEGDLALNKATLPVVYGMAVEHPRRDGLIDLVRTRQLALRAHDVRNWLDAIDTRGFMIWAALEQRAQAVQSLSLCQEMAGRHALESFVNSLFSRFEDMLV